MPINSLDYTIDLSDSRSGRIHITLDLRSRVEINVLVLTALVIANGITVHDLTVTDIDGSLLTPSVKDSEITVAGDRFRLRYTIETTYSVTVGVDKQHDFMYPFANDHEVFFGTGAFAAPLSVCQQDTSVEWQCVMRVVNLPPRFEIFSSVLLRNTEESVSPPKLNAGYLYAGEILTPVPYMHRLTSGDDLTLNVLVAYGKTLPLPREQVFAFIEGYIGFLETRIAPFRHVEAIQLLVLQAPANFEAMAQQQTFATGENLPNGIVAYGPLEGDYLKRTLGYDDYIDFMYAGLAHELLHYYTTSSIINGKSVIYPAPDCPPHDRWLIGEVLVSYFHQQYIAKHHYGDIERFLTHDIARSLNQWARTSQRHYLLDWFAFDVNLRYEHGLTMLDLFRLMVQYKQHEIGPYTSVEWLFKLLEYDGFTLSEPHRALLRESALPDYDRVIRETLRLVGCEVLKDEEEGQVRYRVQRSPHNVPQVDFDL
jgi:hypothetical protein